MFDMYLDREKRGTGEEEDLVGRENGGEVADFVVVDLEALDLMADLTDDRDDLQMKLRQEEAIIELLPKETEEMGS